MSNIVDRVFTEVCLDERIPDGIFRMDEEAHMDALRDYFVKKGITQEAAVEVTNRMVEGKYPDRQAYRKEDGILVTWPSPKHKAKAMQENPGKYTDQNPRPKEREPEPKKDVSPRNEPRDEKPLPKSDEDEPEDMGGRGHGNIFGGEDKKVSQDGKELSVEPPRGDEKPEPPPVPVSPTPPPAPRTPERVAAEKAVVTQIFNGDNTNLSKIEPPLSETCRRQLNELYKKADEMGYREAITFLTPYVKP